jgi:hypothetical protein
MKSSKKKGFCPKHKKQLSENPFISYIGFDTCPLCDFENRNSQNYTNDELKEIMIKTAHEMGLSITFYSDIPLDNEKL